ncbi:MAG: hypothetical protein JRE28_07770 [Deltaproteobacteria bacterium]|nr:hypothetical protein [Deltaproteobacteria bacterium]
MNNNNRQYVIELDGVIYRLKGNRLKQIVDLKESKGEFRFITEMQKTISRTMTVEAPVKYAEFVVRKRLQESGDFDEPVKVLTHLKKKRGKNTTDIFFTALPARHYHAYLEKIRGNEDGILMLPLYAFLYNVLKQIRTEDPVAVVFQHGRFADLIVGDKKQIYYSNRCVAFDMSDEQIAVLWDAVRTDIQSAQTENGIKVNKVYQLNWIDSGDSPEWTENEEYESYHLEEETLSFNNETHQNSFSTALKSRAGNGGISPGAEKIYHYTQKWTTSLNIMLFVFLLAVSSGIFLCQKKTDLLKKELKQLNHQATVLQTETSLSAVPLKTYKNTVGFIKGLVYNKDAPSYLLVMSDVTNGLSPDMETEILKIDYTPNAMSLEIFGKIRTAFNSAHKGYQQFVSFMRSKGYTVVENRFDTDINDSKFLVKLTKRIG